MAYNNPWNSTHNPAREAPDSNLGIPAVYIQFKEYDRKFFGGWLSSRVGLVWVNDDAFARCSGICEAWTDVYGGRLCAIRLSKPFLEANPREVVMETLLHQMIHVYCYIQEASMSVAHDAPLFKKKMCEINRIAGTNITAFCEVHANAKMWKVDYCLHASYYSNPEDPFVTVEDYLQVNNLIDDPGTSWTRIGLYCVVAYLVFKMLMSRG